MNYSSSTKTVSWLFNQFKKGKIAFDHPLQRPVDCWPRENKSLLIHSLLVEYPINPIYVIEIDGVTYPIDGLQRTYNIVTYLNGEYKLAKTTPDAMLTSVEEEDGVKVNKKVPYTIAGKAFPKLDEEVKDTLKNANITIVKMDNYTNKEIREVFRRQNLSIPLNPKLTRVIYESDELLKIVSDLSKHPIVKRICSDSQIKGGSDKDLIIQTLMLIETSAGEADYTSFRKDDINDFVQNYGVDENKVESLKESMDILNTYFNEDKIKMPITSAPMFLYGAYYVKASKKGIGKFATVAKEFINTYPENHEYKEFCTRGTNSRENVNGRWEYWKSLIKNMKQSSSNEPEEATTTSEEE